jgi:hypothetical protein
MLLRDGMWSMSQSRGWEPVKDKLYTLVPQVVSRGATVATFLIENFYGSFFNRKATDNKEVK